MTIIEFDSIPQWYKLSWTESWAFAHNAIQFCSNRFGEANGRWGIFHTEEEVDTYSTNRLEKSLPKRLWFSEPEDALLFKIGFNNCIEYP